MEGGEDANEEPAYTSSRIEFPVDVLSIKVEGADEDGSLVGGHDRLEAKALAGWCIHDGAGPREDVAVVAKRLRCLDDAGNREEFHRQCCEVSCCIAKEVIQIMRSQSYKTSLLQIASEIFLLQDLLNPTHYGCSEELLDSWLSVQEDKDQGTSAILENINKMLALVESGEHLVIFLRSLLKRFGSRFLGLCASLALRALKQQRHLATIDSSQVDDCSGKKKLAETVDLVRQMYCGKERQIYLSCLLSLLYIDPSDLRYHSLENFFTKSSDFVAAADSSSLVVDSEIHGDLLHMINVLRPMCLDLELDWPQLKVLAIDLLYRVGYRYEPTSNTFTRLVSAKVRSDSWGLMGVASDSTSTDVKVKAEALAANGNKVNTDRRSCFSSNSNISYGEENSADDSMLFHGVKVESMTRGRERELIKQNGSSHNPIPSPYNLPDSTDEVQPGGKKPDFPALNGSLDDICSASVGLPWKDAKSRPSPSSTEDDGSNPLNIVSGEEEDGSSTGEEEEEEEGPGVGSSSGFPKKRSASEEIALASHAAMDGGRKRRVLGITHLNSLSKSVADDDDDGGGERIQSTGDEKSHETTLEASHCRRILRPKDRFERVQHHVTRKTFLFKYTFPKKLHMKELEKRSVSEVTTDSDAAPEKAKISVPNGIKLKNCFIRLNRVETEAEEKVAEERESEEEEMEADATAGATMKQELVEEESTEAKEMKEELLEDRVVQCVCDGCGEVVPDCSWLTAHIVTCTGRPECGNADAMMDEELGQTVFQPEVPIWEPLGSSSAGNESAMDVIVSTAGGLNGGVIPIGSTNEVATFASPSDGDVDTSNLMQLLQTQSSTSSSSSFIYDPTTSNSTAGLKVIQISDGTPFSVAAQQQTVLNDVSEEQFGKEIFYNGVYMYEFTEYQCDMCLLTFVTHSAAADHVQSSDHSRSTVSRNLFCCCLKCSIRYREKHIMWHHVLYMCANNVDEVTDESRLYRCLLCCKAFLSAAFLRRHVCLQHSRGQGFSATQRPVSETPDSISIVPQVAQQSCPPSGLSEASRVTDYRVGVDGQLIGAWSCYQLNNGNASVANQAPEDGCLNVFPMSGQEPTEADLKNFSQKPKPAERSIAGGAHDSTSAVSAESGSADSQALLDLACSIVLGGCEPPATNFTDSSLPVNASHSAPAAAAAAVAASAAAVSAAASTPATSLPNSAPASNVSSRRTAKGIMYKNVFMQCIVNYLCSTCKKDLSTKASKKEHKSSPCFDADSKRFTYLRQYSYLCPYCSEKFPSQKFCRQHQLSVCLQLMGIKTDELNHKQLFCPFCDRKYFNIITLKGHMTLIHKVNKIESNRILGTSGLLDELISLAPDGLLEKAKEAKKKNTKIEEEKKKPEVKKRPLPAKDSTSKAAIVMPKVNSSAERQPENDRKGEGNVEKVEYEKSLAVKVDGTWDPRDSKKPGICQVDAENCVSHDSGLECNVADVTHSEEEEVKKEEVKEETNRSNLYIAHDTEVDDLAFDADTSNDVASAEDLSELDEARSCETDNTLPMNALNKESHFDEMEETADEKISQNRRKSKKTRKKVASKSRKKLH